MITAEARAEIRSLLVGATPGPWRVGMDNEVHGPGTLTVLTADLSEEDDYGPSAVLWLGDVDAALIVALRNNAEALLDTADNADGLAIELARYREALCSPERQASQHWVREMEKAEHERDQLRTEVERLGRELKARGLAHVLAKGDA